MLRDRLGDRQLVLQYAESRHLVISGDAGAGLLAFGHWIVEELRRGSGALAMYDFVEGRSHDVHAVLHDLAGSFTAGEIVCDEYNRYLSAQQTTPPALHIESISIGDFATIGRDLNPTVILNGYPKTDPVAGCNALLRDLESNARPVTIALLGMKMSSGICSQPSPPVWDVLKYLLFEICRNPNCIHRVLIAVENAKSQDFPSYFKFHELGTIQATDCGELPDNVKLAYFHERNATSYESYVALLAKLKLDEMEN